MKRGKLFILTGINGAGKGTQAPLLLEKMIENKIPAETLYGPQSISGAASLQNSILHPDTRLYSRWAEALAYFAIHTEAATQVVVPKLEQGISVVLDRGPETTFLYNVLEQGLDESHPELRATYLRINQVLQPTGIILLDAPATVCLPRAQNQSQTDHFQDEKIPQHDSRRRAYLQLGVESEFPWLQVDAANDIPIVAEEIWQKVQPLL